MSTRMMQDQKGWFARVHDNGQVDNLSCAPGDGELTYPLVEITDPRSRKLADLLDRNRGAHGLRPGTSVFVGEPRWEAVSSWPLPSRRATRSTDDAGPECGWLALPGDTRFGCTQPTGHSGLHGPATVTVPDGVKARMIAAYPTVSGMTAEFLAWHATPEEREEAWNRIVAVQNMRDILDATYPAGWES